MDDVVNNKIDEIPEAVLNPPLIGDEINQPRTVFLKKGQVTTWMGRASIVVPSHAADDDDIIKDYTPEQINAANEVARKKVTIRNSARFYEVFLQALFNDPSIDLVQILVTVDALGIPSKTYLYVKRPQFRR